MDFIQILRAFQQFVAKNVPAGLDELTPLCILYVPSSNKGSLLIEKWQFWSLFYLVHTFVWAS